MFTWASCESSCSSFFKVSLCLDYSRFETWKKGARHWDARILAINHSPTMIQHCFPTGPTIWMILWNESNKPMVPRLNASESENSSKQASRWKFTFNYGLIDDSSWGLRTVSNTRWHRQFIGVYRSSSQLRLGVSLSLAVLIFRLAPADTSRFHSQLYNLSPWT
jgi:hypothetical protein